MGKRQLVGLMRVLMQRPDIFILVEATASIDPFTEWQIQQAKSSIHLINRWEPSWGPAFVHPLPVPPFGSGLRQ
jgi:hypothetical protein